MIVFASPVTLVLRLHRGAIRALPFVMAPAYRNSAPSHPRCLTLSDSVGEVQEERAPASSVVPRTPRARTEELVSAAQAGDARALEELLAVTTPPLLRAVRMLIGAERGADLEDVVQDVLLDLVDALASFRGESTFLHFAIRIAVRKTSVARRRAVSVRGWLERFHLGRAPLVHSPATPQDDTRASRRRALLRDVVADLPEAQAEALILRSVLGYSFDEVAATTGAPLNTVRSRLRLAKEALRRRIETDARFLELLDREEP